MHNQGQANGVVLPLTAYAGVTLVSLVILAPVIQLWALDLRIPLDYGGDALAVLSWVKATVESGWYWVNPALGAPGVGELFDYPMIDTVHFVVMKLLSCVCPSYVVVANVYLLLTFPLTALTSLWVLRRLGIAWGPAMLVSLLYTFLPYHFDRGLKHLFLAAYYLIPPAVLVGYWVYDSRPFLFHRAGPDGRLRLNLVGFESVASMVICSLVALAGWYYAAFTGFFLMVTSIGACFARRRLYPLATAGVLCGFMLVSLAVALLPCYHFVQTHGSNPLGLKRTPAETEKFGLNITHLLVPDAHHLLRNVHPFFTSGISRWGVYLGLVGGVGFVVLIGRLFFRGRGSGLRSGLLNFLALQTGSGTLLATVGGFGLLFSLEVSASIRCYYRMCVFLGFFALTAVGIGLERVARRFGDSRVRRGAFYALLVGLLGFGLVDQIPKPVLRDYDLTCQLFADDAAFVRAIEATLPPGAMVFELPYSPWPEPPAEYQVPGRHYEGLRPSLHSKSLRWSYGAYKGRPWDKWQHQVVARPVDDMVRQLALSGFAGIYLDKDCCPVKGCLLETGLTRASGVKALVSPDGRRLFFPLADYRSRLKASLASLDWEYLTRAALDPIQFAWMDGFSYLETTPAGSHRWCAHQGELHLVNAQPVARTVIVDMAFSTGQLGPNNLRIESQWFSDCLAVGRGDFTPWTKTLTLPPGEHIVRFRCDAAKIEVVAPRTMVFCIHNFKYTDVAPGLHAEGSTVP
jgi:phosphoglycerol transferase